MPQYKLIYFNGCGRAENTRMALEYAGVQYEDVRLEGGEFVEYKPKAPFGQLPVLVIDGEKTFGQSNAILRYVARETALDGGSSINRLKVDMIVDTVGEITNGILSWFFEADQNKRTEISKQIFKDKVPAVLRKLEGIVKNDDTGFIVGSSVTIADIAIANALSALQELPEDFDLKKYPSLLALQARVHNLPRIKSWIQRRPTTPF